MAKRKDQERERYMSQFWERLVYAIQSNDKKQIDFAKKVGISDNQFSLCKSRCAEIRISTLAKIIELYDIDVNWLFRGGSVKDGVGNGSNCSTDLNLLNCYKQIVDIEISSAQSKRDAIESLLKRKTE